ncbi:unnamed protein product [Angiostrongylus costaricensis]|uniref:Exonuclease domain-containing protein n=1 Tax=Angiostrongylus costaricensis TaxID=334426 RepID=A0A0R3PXP5_ANGCS|nr:unnamed protein product [Angiostrongylus costaricensis]
MEKSKNRRLNKLRKKISELFLLGGLSEEEMQAIEEAELATSSRETFTEVRELVQYTVIGPLVGKPKWAHFRPWKSTSQTVVIRADVPNEYLANNGFSFSFIENFFEKQWIRMDSAVKDRESFWDHLMKVPVGIQEQIRERVLRIDPLEGLGKCAGLKTELLITTPEMVENGYPFPDDSIIATKDKYATVTRDSPVFALDCEMCVTSAGHHELTRISIVREDGTVVLDTLVKPYNEITDYLTKFSGITPELMECATTSLEDVQAAIRSILPPDGILCGHSLEFDLHSLQMAHPYCIDIGLIYNLSGTARNKTSLKNLMAVFFDEEIQVIWGSVVAIRMPHVCGCGHVIGVECTVEYCQCQKFPPSECVKCLVNNGKASFEGNFDWSGALRGEYCSSYRPLSYYLVDSKKTVMCGFSSATQYNIEKNKVFTLRRPGSFSSTSAFVDEVSCDLLEYGLALIEIDYLKRQDEIVRAAARFSLIIVVLSSEKSSICYLKVKH